MKSDNKYKITKNEQEKLNILKLQSQNIGKIETQTNTLIKNTDISIKSSEALLQKLDIETKSVTSNKKEVLSIRKKLELRSWDEILLESEQNLDSPALMQDVLTIDEINRIEKKLVGFNSDFKSIYKLDKIDWAICGVAGILASLVDVFLIQMPKHPGYLGGKASNGGSLSNWIKEKVNGHFPPGEITKLERENWVPYDAPNSSKLKIPIDGLYPKTHRFQSLGHDPILGFIFGVKDLLQGTFTAIDKNGVLISQTIPNIKDQSILGMNLFGAIARVFGHMKSDFTPMGLPVPIMPLFQYLQFGNIGKHKHTIGEVSRIMYREGYNFSHFLAMSISPLLIEVIVRICYFAKKQYEGYSFTEAIPFNIPTQKKKPKLQTMLFASHLIATGANAGKVAITQNPLSINYSQWIAFFRYAFPQLKWIIYEKENKRFNYVQKKIDTEWALVDKELIKTWDMVSEQQIYLS